MDEDLKQQKFQKIRLLRIAMAGTTYIFVLLVAYLIQLVNVGFMPAWLWILMGTTAIAGTGVFCLLVITNTNLKFKDPSMTRPQIIWSAVWGMMGVIALPAARPLVLMLYLASFMFGAMRLDRKKYLELVFILSSILASGIMLEYLYIRPQMNVAFEFLIWSCFSLTLIWFAFFGSYLYSTKRKLRDSKNELERVQTELQATSEKLQRAADTDYLTGVLNRRAFYENVEQMPHKQNLTYTVILQDIDHFKSINDTYGHDIGDDVLVEAVKRINYLLRPGDILSRWGGEEFLVLLNNLEFNEAQKVAERIRVNFEEQPIQVKGEEIPLTISQGLVQVNTLNNLDDAIKQADELLYLAKRRGRNRLELASRQNYQ